MRARDHRPASARVLLPLSGDGSKTDRSLGQVEQHANQESQSARELEAALADLETLVALL